MEGRRKKRAARPLDEPGLEQLALRYVGRYATTRARLASYLQRKIKDRGWEGRAEPVPSAIAERLAGLGYIDDRAFALAKASAHFARGFGKRRLAGALQSAGIEQDDGEDALQLAEEEAFESALRFAHRRRLGPFGTSPAGDRKQREKAIAAMLRAGHRFEIAAAIVDCRADDPRALAELRQRFASPEN